MLLEILKNLLKEGERREELSRQQTLKNRLKRRKFLKTWNGKNHKWVEIDPMTKVKESKLNK